MTNREALALSTRAILNTDTGSTERPYALAQYCISMAGLILMIFDQFGEELTRAYQMTHPDGTVQDYEKTGDSTKDAIEICTGRNFPGHVAMYREICGFVQYWLDQDVVLENEVPIWDSAQAVVQEYDRYNEARREGTEQ